VPALRDRIEIGMGVQTNKQVDAAWHELHSKSSQMKVKRAISKNTQPNVASVVNINQGGRILQVGFTSQPPAQAHVSRNYALLLPRDAAGDDDIQLFATASETFTARMDEVIPSISGVLTIRLRMFAERLVGELLDQLRMYAETAMRGSDGDPSKI
jgi:hypothetical protein